VVNMSYCRFENTYNALRECEEHIEDEDLSDDEKKYRERLVKLCGNIFDCYPDY
jgi:hypothetical protein